MKVKLNNVRLAFPELFEAKTVNGEGKPASSASFLIDPADPLVKALNQAIEDPYYQQGGDIVRVGGLKYAIDPLKRAGARTSRMELAGKPIDAAKRYKVAGWAPVSEEASKAGGEPIWDLVERYLVREKTIRARPLNRPEIVGVKGNPGIA